MSSGHKNVLLGYQIILKLFAKAKYKIVSLFASKFATLAFDGHTLPIQVIFTFHSFGIVTLTRNVVISSLILTKLERFILPETVFQVVFIRFLVVLLIFTMLPVCKLVKHFF